MGMSHLAHGHFGNGPGNAGIYIVILLQYIREGIGPEKLLISKCVVLVKGPKGSFLSVMPFLRVPESIGYLNQ